MKDIADSEILVTFDESRDNFKPYGLTCEKWALRPMRQFDRHNEIEMNFVPEGDLSYSFLDRRIVIPKGRLSIFWGLMPHRVDATGSASEYYVATIPFSTFLGWELPKCFVNDILNGGVLIEEDTGLSSLDMTYFKNWINDLSDIGASRIVMLEMKSRLLRFSGNYTKKEQQLCGAMTGKIEQMALFIAQSYALPLKVEDIGSIVGLNPDYAGNIFKKAFGHTIKEHIIMERITHAQRQLLVSSDPILQISYDCGFNSVSSFNIAFKRINGCTPREYRRLKSTK